MQPIFVRLVSSSVSDDLARGPSVKRVLFTIEVENKELDKNVLVNCRLTEDFASGIPNLSTQGFEFPAAYLCASPYHYGYDLWQLAMTINAPSNGVYYDVVMQFSIHYKTDTYQGWDKQRPNQDYFMRLIDYPGNAPTVPRSILQYAPVITTQVIDSESTSYAQIVALDNPQLKIEAFYSPHNDEWTSIQVAKSDTYLGYATYQYLVNFDVNLSAPIFWIFKATWDSGSWVYWDNHFATPNNPASYYTALYP